MNKIKIQNEETSRPELERVAVGCQAHPQAAQVERALCGPGGLGGPAHVGPHCRPPAADARGPPHRGN